MGEPAVKIATDRKTSAKIKHWKLRYICRETYEEGLTLPIWISTHFNESDTGTKCQNPVAFNRTSQMFKGYAPMCIPTEYNPKRINLNGPRLYYKRQLCQPIFRWINFSLKGRVVGHTSNLYFYRRYRFSSL
eukprot:COSAG01_NODE_2378_length_7796_cov_5.017020_8_plen_132_part_00